MPDMPLLAAFDLEAGAGRALLAEIAGRASPRLVAFAGRLARSFTITSPYAPGLCCIGGEVALDEMAAAAEGSARVSVTGSAESPDAALVACLGEGADLASQYERPGDVATTGPAGADARAIAGGWLATAIGDGRRVLDWVRGVEADGGGTVLLPADLCLRRPPERRAVAPIGALSAGVAAGPTFEAAALRAILELCERDAAALWWLGGRRPRSLPLEHPAVRLAVELVAALRRTETRRRTALLDITTDIAVPAVAAVSVAADGRGLACGVAARLDAAAAARAAILEMCQMELAAPVAAAKRSERGDAGLNAADRRHLERAGFAAESCPLLWPGSPAPATSETPAPDAAAALAALAARLGRNGIPVFLVDMTRPEIGVPVVRAVAPGLQPFGADARTPRLAAARAAADAADVPAAPLF